MKRCIALLLVLLSLTVPIFSGCDGEVGDVTIDGSQIIPNQNGETENVDPDINPDNSKPDDNGIGNNEMVDLPYLPV